MQAFYDENMKNVLSFPEAFHSFMHLSPYLRHYINNHGDPFDFSGDFWYQKSKALEKSTIEFIADMYQV